MIDCLILAGGRGTRIAHLLPEGCPKFLAPVAGRPFADHLMDQLHGWEVERIFVATGHNAKAIFHWTIWNVPIDIELKVFTDNDENGEPKGIESACRTAATDYLSTPTVLVCNGDTLVDVDFPAMLEFHLARAHRPCRAVASGVDTGLGLYPRTLLGSDVPWLEFPARSFVDIGTPAVYELVREAGFK